MNDRMIESTRGLAHSSPLKQSVNETADPRSNDRRGIVMSGQRLRRGDSSTIQPFNDVTNAPNSLPLRLKSGVCRLNASVWQPLADSKKPTKSSMQRSWMANCTGCEETFSGRLRLTASRFRREACEPSKIIAVGLNYADHARETGKPLPKEPLFWFKATTSLIPDGGKIEIPFPSHRTDFEAELCIVIGRRMRNVAPAAASRYILGYTTSQDISDRTIQNGESQWARAKSFDTFTPFGPYVETKIDPHDLTIQLFQNGQLRQNSNTSQLIFNCYRLVSFVSINMTLLPGDLILTGTPSGVGPIESGDRLEVRIQGLAPLVNTVK